MKKRRSVFKLGVTYDTKKEHLEEIPKIIKEVIEEFPDTEFGRAHFANYGDFSLNFETAFYVLTEDYNRFMDVQEQVNLKLYKIFNEKGISFAFPTQTLHLHKKDKS
jgi:small-conductance mechanosensitive channel